MIPQEELCVSTQDSSLLQGFPRTLDYGFPENLEQTGGCL